VLRPRNENAVERNQSAHWRFFLLWGLTGYGKERKGEKYMECHVAPDWLLIWVQKDNEMVLVFTNTGSHAKMFGI